MQTNSSWPGLLNLSLLMHGYKVRAHRMAWTPYDEKSGRLTSLESKIASNNTDALINRLEANRPQTSASMKRKPAIQTVDNFHNIRHEQLVALLDDRPGTEKLGKIHNRLFGKEAHSKSIKYPSNTRESLIEWEWEYRSDGENEFGEIRAEGTFFTDYDQDGDGWHEIVSIRGQYNQENITGLFPTGESIPGNSPFEGDNLIRVGNGDKLEPEAQLSGDGFQFALDDGSYVNVFFASFLAPPGYLEFHSREPFPEGNVLPNTEIEVWFEAKPDFV